MPKPIPLKKGTQQSITNFFTACPENNIVTKAEIHTSDINHTMKRKFTSLKSETDKSSCETKLAKKNKLETAKSKNSDTKKVKIEKTPKNNIIEDVPSPTKTKRVAFSPVKIDLNQLPGKDETDNSRKPRLNFESVAGFGNENEDLFLDLDFKDFVENYEELDLSKMQRCQVVHINQDTSKTELKLKDVNDKQATCFVEGIWRYIPLSIGEKISVIANRNSDGTFSIDNNNGLLVLRPDHLMSSTSIVGGVFCQRKAILQDTFRGLGCANEAMTVGTIIHELVQKTLSDKVTNAQEIRKLAETILHQCIPLLYDAGLTIQGVLDSIAHYIPPLVDFMKTYFVNNIDQNAATTNKNGKWNGHIDELLDIEENVCCPELGVKGKIDATLKVTIHEKKSKIKAVVPLELKSGQGTGSAEHRGQVVLYCMMLALQRGDNPAAPHHYRGLLLYLRDKVNLQEINLGYPERRDLVMLRNQLVQYLADPPDLPSPDTITDIEDLSHVYRQQLPEPVRNERACGKCPYLTICSVYLWNTEGPKVSECHPLSSLQSEAIGHLSPSHIQYFLHWAALLKVEEKGQMMSNPLHCLWTESPEKRASRGVCLCNLHLKSVENQGDRFVHTFVHTNATDKRGPQPGEYSIVSLNKRPWIAAGTILARDSGTVSILLERDIGRRHTKSTLYHIDSYESHSSTILNLTNVGALMDDTDEAGRLRRLIIDKTAPTFEAKLHREVGRIGVKLMKGLNRQQQKAVLKALTAKDYMLLQGLPGTGKTQTISVLIQMLVALKQRVLVTAHTHSAVDTLLTRLPQYLRILRLGSSSRVNPALAATCEDKMTANVSSPEQLDKLYKQMEVVGVTCLGSNHALLSKITFDVCIVDEATQVLQSTVLRPLLAAKRFVLVGDPDQLPPVVRSPHARRLGLEESLFCRLLNAGGTEMLSLQYRMNSAITALANTVAYCGNLRCADDTVSNDTISIHSHIIKQKYSSIPWIEKVCSTYMDDAVIFLDTGHTGHVDSDTDNKCTNKQEVCVVLAILEALQTGEIKATDIGIIAPYRDQVSLLRTSTELVLPKYLPDISTVDQFQGKDKSVIIYSCTKYCRSDDWKAKETEILNDHRRLAVAVTRAKHKLIVIGDSKTLQKYSTIKRLIDACAHLVLDDMDHKHLAEKYSI